MHKCIMPRLLTESDYLLGTIAKKDFTLPISPVLSKHCWQLPPKTPPSVYHSKLACILIASASHLMTIVLVCQKNYNKHPNLQDQANILTMLCVSFSWRERIKRIFTFHITSLELLIKMLQKIKQQIEHTSSDKIKHATLFQIACQFSAHWYLKSSNTGL